MVMKSEIRSGTGIIAKYNDRFIFAIGNKRFWTQEKGSLTITYTAIGGKVEEGETFVSAAIREVQEESDTQVDLIDSPKTLLWDFTTRKSKIVRLEEKMTKPVIIYKRADDDAIWVVYVFLANFKTEPIPKMEVPALLLLHKDFLVDKRNISVEEHIKRGNIILEQERNVIPRHAILKPFGSAKIVNDLSDKQFNELISENL
jgi:8-oxo-dGTP pyrophosphatase MutT (NUDIX family)